MDRLISPRGTRICLTQLSVAQLRLLRGWSRASLRFRGVRSIMVDES